MEWECTHCGNTFRHYSAKFHDLMREVLADNGIDAK